MRLPFARVRQCIKTAEEANQDTLAKLTDSTYYGLVPGLVLKLGVSVQLSDCFGQHQPTPFVFACKLSLFPVWLCLAAKKQTSWKEIQRNRIMDCVRFRDRVVRNQICFPEPFSPLPTAVYLAGPPGRDGEDSLQFDHLNLREDNGTSII